MGRFFVIIALYLSISGGLAFPCPHKGSFSDGEACYLRRREIDAVALNIHQPPTSFQEPPWPGPKAKERT